MPDSESQVIDALRVAVCTTDLEGRIRSANRSWLQFARDAGAKVRSVQGVSLPGLIDDPAFSAHVTRALERLGTGTVPLATWEFSRGRAPVQRHYLGQGTPLRDAGAGAAITGAVFCVVDITTLQASFHNLLEAGTALASADDEDGFYHALGHELRRWLRAQAFAVWQDSGVPAGLRVIHLVADDADRAGVEDRLAGVATTALESGSVVVRVSGTGRCLAAPMATGDGSSGALAVYTESFESPFEEEEARRLLSTLSARAGTAFVRVRQAARGQKLQRRVDIGEVASGVAQELRQPLFGISSAAQLLRFRAREDVVIEKNVGRILHEVDRLNRLASSLADFGRPRPGHFVSGDPDHVWDEVLEAGRGLLEARSLTVARSRPPHPGVIAIDREQLRQAFNILLVNAVEHAPPASMLRLGSVHTGGGWETSLTNPGAVAPEVLDRAFDLFFTTKAGSTGVGLALCRRIVEGHGGRIRMDSASGEATVTVSLPPKAG